MITSGCVLTQSTLSRPKFVASYPPQVKVAAAIADKDVGVLINNVGVSYPFPKYFDELTDDEVSRRAFGRILRSDEIPWGRREAERRGTCCMDQALCRHRKRGVSVGVVTKNMMVKG